MRQFVGQIVRSVWEGFWGGLGFCLGVITIILLARELSLL